MTTPTNPNQTPRAARPDVRTAVLLTFDYMSDALARRDGEAFVNCIESLRLHLGDPAVDAMVTYFIEVGRRRLAARLIDRNLGGGAR
ncbi:hypothetical protein AB0K00_40105 [Dactylosporangium sp. NPDC049525]|uniref:hypothetical protein n=1 Tax=Dactylosporangium sp. NPDC049525 TaxID=3154730 RepID=UPI00343542D5